MDDEEKEGEGKLDRVPSEYSLEGEAQGSTGHDDGRDVWDCAAIPPSRWGTRDANIALHGRRSRGANVRKSRPFRSGWQA